jgi:anti-sigma regulatory factor (Ser/Thr protein kinase)
MSVEPPQAPGALDQRFDAGTLSQVRAAALAHAVSAGMADVRAADVMMAVHELAANVVRHGTGSGQLRMHIADGALRCTVHDGDKAARTVADAGRWRCQPGHGLWLVREVADQVTVIHWPGGSQVTLAFMLPGRGESPA